MPFKFCFYALQPLLSDLNTVNEKAKLSTVSWRGTVKAIIGQCILTLLLIDH